MRFIRISGNATRNPPDPSSPLEMLQGCHARIRHFMQLSRTLADAEDAPHNEISAASSAIFRYFSHALPLHEADENETLFPRLQKALPLGGLVLEAAITMVEQHKAIDELAQELLSLCASLGSHPARLPSFSPRLVRVTQALSEVFVVHLNMEETVIFPAIQEILTPADIEEMSAEMHRRRQPPSDAIHLV